MWNRIDGLGAIAEAGLSDARMIDVGSAVVAATSNDVRSTSGVTRLGTGWMGRRTIEVR